MNLIAKLGIKSAMNALGLRDESEIEKMMKSGLTEDAILKLKKAARKQKKSRRTSSIKDTNDARKIHGGNSGVLGLVYTGLLVVGGILTLLIFYSPPGGNVNIIENALVLLIGSLIGSGCQFYFGASNKE